jgi:hypothetical protein
MTMNSYEFFCYFYASGEKRCLLSKSANIGKMEINNIPNIYPALKALFLNFNENSQFRDNFFPVRPTLFNGICEIVAIETGP